MYAFTRLGQAATQSAKASRALSNCCDLACLRAASYIALQRGEQLAAEDKEVADRAERLLTRLACGSETIDLPVSTTLHFVNVTRGFGPAVGPFTVPSIFGCFDLKSSCCGRQAM